MYMPTAGVADVLNSIGRGLGAGLTAVTQPTVPASAGGVVYVPGTAVPAVPEKSGFEKALPFIVIGAGVLGVAFLVTRKK